MNRTQVLQEIVDNHWKKVEETDKRIYSQLALYIFYLEGKKTESDLYILAKLLSEEDLRKIINYFSSSEKGGKLQLPSNDEYKRAYLLGVCYYLKEVKKWDWNKIKDFLPLPEQYQDILSPISIGKRINQISEHINHELITLLSKCNIEDVVKALEESDVK